MELSDLTPQKDPKGGSPKSPYPPPSASDYQAQVPIVHQNGTVWKVLAAAGWGTVLPLLGMWWTALQSKGVSYRDMQEYVAAHDTSIGREQGLIDQALRDRNS